MPANSFHKEQIEKSHKTTAVFGHVPDRSSIQPRVSKNSVFILESLVGLDGSTKMRSFHFYGFSHVATKMAIE